MRLKKIFIYFNFALSNGIWRRPDVHYLIKRWNIKLRKNGNVCLPSKAINWNFKFRVFSSFLFLLPSITLFSYEFLSRCRIRQLTICLLLFFLVGKKDLFRSREYWKWKPLHYFPISHIMYGKYFCFYIIEWITFLIDIWLHLSERISYTIIGC